ncbi:MAG: hypothetical protein HZB92_01840 [Euryarchaeota archaeon]|nr:hypothetical protein [Euryarchaeota archaeon]
MYLLGHSAFAYLLCRLGYLAKKRDPDPRIVLLVMVFANVPDATHFGIFREMTHNVIGTVLFALLCMLVLERLKVVGQRDFPVLLFAALTHAWMDIFFSGYQIAFPPYFYSYTMFAWNSGTHIISEGLLGIGFVIVLYFSGDLGRMADAARREWAGLRAHRGSLREARPAMTLAFLFIVYLMLAVAQLSGAISINRPGLLAGWWPSWLFIGVYVMFIFCLNAIAFGKAKIISEKEAS